VGLLGLEFRILGPLEVRADGVAVPMGGPRQRALLALLLLSANRAVSRDRLMEELMLDPPGEKAARALTVQVSRLRKALGSIDGSEPRLVASPPGYMLQVKPGELDLDTFERLLADGQGALEGGDPAGAAVALRQAEALWRGRPLADLEFEPFARLEAERLEELRLGAVEERIEAELALGRHAALCPELETLVEEHPLRERLRGLLMVALYRAGRQAEALESYRAGRRELVDELGLEPGPELRELERAILAHDPALRLGGTILTHDPAPRPERAIPVSDQAPEPAPRPRAPKRPGGRELAVGLAVGLVVAAAIVVALISGGSSSARLAANGIGAIATDSGQVMSAIPVNAQPTSVAVGSDGSIWVVSAAAGTLWRVNPRTRAVTGPIVVGNDPVAVAVAPDGAVWVANSGDGTVSRVSPEDNEVIGPPVGVGTGPSALVATNNAVWVANTLSASVSKIDPATDSVVATFPVGSEPAGIAVGDGSIWVANEGDDTVWRLDQQTGAQAAAPITVGNGPTGIAFGDSAAWVVNSIDDTLMQIDPSTNTVTGTKRVGPGPYDVAVEPHRVWVSDEYGNSIVGVDPVTLAVLHATKTSSAPLGLAVVGDRLWVATDGNGEAAHRGGVLDALASGINGALGDPPTIAPESTYTEDGPRVLIMTGDGLVAYRRDGGVQGSQLMPDLAVSLPEPTDSGLTYTFHIRSAIRYSNGVPLRASDFRRGLERSFRVGAGLVQYYTALVGGQRCLKRPSRCDLSRGIVADDAAATVTFHLTHPDPDLFAKLTLPVAWPVPPGTPVHLRARSIPGTGAYEISYYRPAASNNPHAHGLLVLTRNPYFHQWSVAAQPTGFPNRIVIRTGYSPAQQVTAVEQGRADLAWDTPPQAEITALSQNFASQLHKYTNSETTWLWLNVRSAPFDNPQARRAVDYALDRGAVSQASPIGAYDHGRPTCQMLPPTFPGYIPHCPYTVDPTPSQRWLAPDLAKAQGLVHRSGTFGDEVALLARSADGHRYAHLLAATLSEIGYRVRTQEVSDNYFGRPARFYARFQAGIGNWSADYVASSQFFTPFIECSDIASNGGFNWGGFCDHSLDASIKTALSNQVVAPGVASRQWAAIDREAAASAPVIPISNQLEWDFVARRVGNYQNNPQWGVLVDQLWVR
jgi:YVTN family beta-propeller protein